MKPVILVTVYRRYHELIQSLDHIQTLIHEFREPPDVIVVWAIPQLGHLWLMDSLIEQGKVTAVVGRPQLPDETPGAATTYPESYNLRKGLNYIKRNYEECYVIGHAADIQAMPGAYRFIDNKIHEGEKAVLYHWANGCCREDVWHTNFFAIPLDEEYWPPISTKQSGDVLERQWGLSIAEKKPDRVFKWHNSRNQSFLHDHISENLPEITVVPLTAEFTLNLTIKGYKTFWAKLFELFWKKRNSK